MILHVTSIAEKVLKYFIFFYCYLHFLAFLD